MIGIHRTLEKFPKDFPRTVSFYENRLKPMKLALLTTAFVTVRPLSIPSRLAMIFLGQRLPAGIANWCRTMVALNIMEIILAWIRGCDRDRR